MNPIREFFKRKAAERKFKTAGPAHKLAESSSSSAKSKDCSRSVSEQSSYSHKPSREAERAGAAALERIQQKQQQSNLNWSSQAIKNQAKKELELENSSKENKILPTRQTITVEDVCQNYTVAGVYFTCPIIGPEILPKDAIEEKIRLFLYDQLEQERGLTACLIIHTLNKNKIFIQKGIEILARYLTNIIDQPTEEKYRKIRLKNKAFQERVADLEGAFEFLVAAGFSCQKLKINEEEEEYFVLQDENLDIEKLQMLKEAILSAEPILPILDRNLKVLKPVEVAEEINLPNDFFNLTVDEVKREQESRTETVEMLSQLRTKAMREKESRGRHLYKYSLIRVRFPDSIILQGTFSVHEKLSSVKEFVSKNLMDPGMEFEILLPGGAKLIDDSLSLLELKLVPAVILNFKASCEDTSDKSFLNSECMSLLSDL